MRESNFTEQSVLEWRKSKTYSWTCSSWRNLMFDVRQVYTRKLDLLLRWYSSLSQVRDQHITASSPPPPPSNRRGKARRSPARSCNSSHGTCILITLCIERRGRVVNPPASYSGGPWFKSWPGDRLSWGSSTFYSAPPGQCRDNTTKKSRTASF
jgi:hypothetical protein